MGQCFCTALCQLEKHPNPKTLTEREESVRRKKGVKIAPEPTSSDSERYSSAFRHQSLAMWTCRV